MKKNEAAVKGSEELSWADIKAMFAENARLEKERYAEAARLDADLRAEAARLDADLRAEAARLEKERYAEAAKRDAKADEEFRKWKEENDRVTKEWNRRLGGMDENIGLHAEQFFQDSLAKTLTFGGEKYNKILNNVQGSNNTTSVEFDIVLVNGKSVAVIEVKNRIHPKNVTEMTDVKLAKFRSFFPEYQKHKVYLGLAGFSFSQKAREDALSRGIGILKQAGDSVETDAGHLKAY